MSQVISENIWNILAVITYLIIGVGVIYTIKGDVRAVVQSLEAAMRRLDNVETEIFELRKVVISMARQEERMNAMDMRMIAQGKRVDSCDERINKVLDRAVHT